MESFNVAINDAITELVAKEEQKGVANAIPNIMATNPNNDEDAQNFVEELNELKKNLRKGKKLHLGL